MHPLLLPSNQNQIRIILSFSNSLPKTDNRFNICPIHLNDRISSNMKCPTAILLYSESLKPI